MFVGQPLVIGVMNTAGRVSGRRVDRGAGCVVEIVVPADRSRAAVDHVGVVEQRVGEVGERDRIEGVVGARTRIQAARLR